MTYNNSARVTSTVELQVKNMYMKNGSHNNNSHMSSFNYNIYST